MPFFSIDAIFIIMLTTILTCLWRKINELKLNHKMFLLRHHIGAAQFWEMGRGTGFELGEEGIPLGGESERERVDPEVSARFWGDESVLAVCVSHGASGGDARHRVHVCVPVETLLEGGLRAQFNNLIRSCL
jgi:hypothetical protein